MKMRLNRDSIRDCLTCMFFEFIIDSRITEQRINETVKNLCFDSTIITMEEKKKRGDLIGSHCWGRRETGEDDKRCIDWEDCLIEL